MTLPSVVERARRCPSSEPEKTALALTDAAADRAGLQFGRSPQGAGKAVQRLSAEARSRATANSEVLGFFDALKKTSAGGLFCGSGAYGICQLDSFEASIDSVSAGVCHSCCAIANPGEEGLRLFGRRSFAGSKVDVLDDDGLGLGGEHAPVHDEWLAQEGNAASSALVRRGVRCALDPGGCGAADLGGG